MAGVYRPTYTRPIPEGAKIGKENGKPVCRYTDKRGKAHVLPLTEDGGHVVHEQSRWWMRYSLPDGSVKRAKGYRDRQATEQEAARREKEAAGLDSGLIVVTEAHLTAPIAEHLAAYMADRERAGCVARYSSEVRNRLNRVIKGCGWLTLRQVKPDALTKFLAQRKDKGDADRTINNALSSAKSFLRWCVRQNRIAANPLESVTAIGNVEDVYRRRALKPDEVQRLLAVAPESRRAVYIVALRTGLRWTELKLLQWQDIHIGANERPHIKLRPNATKAKRGDVLPLRADVVELLKGMRPAFVAPTVPVFEKVPKNSTFVADLKAAKIPVVDGEGRRVSFHSLRVTFGSMLQVARVPLATAMTLMRHKDPKLTLGVYTDLTLLDIDGAVERLPDLTQAAGEVREVRTGTDAAPDLVLSKSSGSPFATPHTPAQMNASQPVSGPEKRGCEDSGSPRKMLTQTCAAGIVCFS